MIIQQKLEETNIDELGEDYLAKSEELRAEKDKHEREYQLYYNKIKHEVAYIGEVYDSILSDDLNKITSMKIGFYKKYFKLQNFEKLEEICLEYLKGIQFVLYYYYRGCPSWSWFYPYFMSPFLSDLKSVLGKIIASEEKRQILEFDFDLSEPYKPFTQLMLILPRNSLDLLPKIYKEQVIKPDSPIARFYPEEFEFHPFDGIQEYKWIADIEIINKEMVDREIKKISFTNLSKDEMMRNSRGADVRYTYNPRVSEIHIKSEIEGLESFEEKIEIEKKEKKTYKRLINENRIALKERVESAFTDNLKNFLEDDENKIENGSLNILILAWCIEIFENNFMLIGTEDGTVIRVEEDEYIDNKTLELTKNPDINSSIKIKSSKNKKKKKGDINSKMSKI